MKIKHSAGILLLSIASVSNIYAQSTGRPFGPDDIFYSLFSDLTGLISTGVIGLIIGATIAMFFFALFRGMMRAQGGEDIKKNKDTMLWGIGILFVMVSIWGIIVFFQDALLKDYKDKKITLPSIPNTSNYGQPNDGSDPNSGRPSNNARPNPNASGNTTGKLIFGAECTADSQCSTGSCPFVLGRRTCGFVVPSGI